ncbi:MAG: hypothetical protein RML45_13515 [Acetobacteraceae bacterium]|nr:hypothetical protein [Acetobacteraceae bacterium]
MSARDVAAGLACAVLMARGRAEGLRLLDGSPATAWRSFLAMLVASPLYLALKVVSAPPLPRGVDPLRLVAAEAIGYVLGWFATALVMLAVARVLDREGRWPLFVAAWNWSNVVQLVVFLAGAVVASRLPAVLAGGVTLRCSRLRAVAAMVRGARGLRHSGPEGGRRRRGGSRARAPSLGAHAFDRHRTMSGVGIRRKGPGRSGPGSG